GLSSTEPWVIEKQDKITQIIINAMGIAFEFTANKELAYPSELVNSSLIVNNPSSLEMKVTTFELLEEELPVHQTLKHNDSFSLDVPVALPNDYPISQPYWIAQEPKNNLFQISEQSAIGRPFNKPAVVGKLSFSVEGMELITEVPLKYKYNDQVDGEINQPFTVIP